MCTAKLPTYEEASLNADMEESSASAFPATMVVSAATLNSDENRQLGVGAFGVVWCVKSDASGRQLAVKKLADLETTSSARRVYNELCCLTYFHHENIISLQGVVLSPAADDFSEVYIVSELMATDLRRVLVSGQRLNDCQVQLFLYQILNALKYIHSLKVIHGDIKPENVLVNADCRLKIGDFGLVTKQPTTDTDDTSDPGEPQPAGSDSVEPSTGASFGSGDVRGTLSYAAPELLLGMLPTTAVDMWATGCLTVEMITGRVLFQASTIIRQLDLMFELLGMTGCGMDDFTGATEPAKRYLRRKLSSPNSRAVIGSKSLLSSALPADYNIQHLLTRLLVFSPRQRLSARQAMQHLEAGGRMYHSTLCNCCQHNAPATQSVDTDQSNSRLHGHCTNPQFTADSRPLPEQRQANNIPLDISNDASVDTASVDVFKDKIRQLCQQIDFHQSSHCHNNSTKTIIQQRS